MALALCLTLLPTAALADELGPVDGTSTVETAGADAEAEAKAKTGAEAVAAVQAMIGELPSLGELKGMDSDTLNEAYMAVQSAYDAYEDLTAEQQAQVTGADCFEELFGWFNSQVAPLADVYYYCDVVDVATGKMVQGRWSRTATASLTNDAGDTELRSNAVYVIAPNEQVTIRGSLTVPENSNDIYLFLCQNATLTIEGSLILNSNALTIFGSTTSLDAAASGKMIIENSGDGAAIQADGSDRNVTIRGGKLEINSNTSKQITDAHASVLPIAWGNTGSGEYKVMKATLDGQQLKAADWDGKTQLTGGTLLIEWCEHEDNEKLSYVDNKDNATHHMKCDLCGFEWTEGEYSQLNHEYDKYEKIDEIYHKATCVCGYEASAQKHEFETGPGNKPVWTSDGKGHVSGVCACGYSSGTVKAHDYDESGTCKDCKFKPAFEDSEGNLYEYNGSDSIDALNEAIKKGETSFKLVNFAQGEGADAATVEAAFALETDANVTLDMNGKTLKDSGGTPVLTVSSGALTVTGDAAIIQGGASQEMYKPAIEVTGGSLVFAGDLTAQGGKYGNYDRQPAVKATGGTVEFKGALNLDGGLFLDSCERLASKLTQGRFYSDNNDQGQVYRVQIKDDYQHSYDLLADGYAFAEYDAATGKAKVDENGNPVLVDAKLSSLRMNKDVIIVAHTHSIEEGQSACACGKRFEAGIPADDGTITYYETIDEAFANVKANETVKLMIDSDDRSRFNTIYVIGGPYTFDLNGHRVGRRMGDDFKQAVLQVGAPDGNSGTLTVLDSSKTDDTEGTGYFYELELYNGSLTVESGSFYRYWESAPTATGTMTFKGGTVDEFYATSANVETKLYGGTFGNVYNNIGGKPGDLLADNRAFFNRDNNFVNGYDYQAVRDVVVKDHTHNIVDGSCECGFTCAHDWSDKNGVCKKANCGYHCPHNAGAAEVDGVWVCNTCGQTVTAKVVAPDGTITYYADGHLDNGIKKSGLYFAIKAAKTDSTVTMLGGGCMAGGYVTGGQTLTLDVSNGKTIDGILYVGDRDAGNKLIVRGSAEISYVIVDPNNTLDLTGWTGRIGSLTVLNGGEVTLNGGTFAKLNVNGAAAGSLLASGYAFQNADTGAYVEYSSTANMENVKVVKCPHSNVTPKGDHTGVECKYCGASFAATLDDAPYSTIDDAVSVWLKTGGTLKLYADYTAATEKATWTIVSGEHSIDLNGHRMSVQGDGAFKPTNNMHLTVTDGTEVGQITNILLDGSQGGSFTLESGFVTNLEMTGDAVVTLKGGSVDTLDVRNSSANTNLSIQGGSIGDLNIKDWAEGMHVSATGGSLGAYSLPSGKILADVLDHQYYAEGTSLDRQVDTAQNPGKFVIKQAPYDFGSTSKAAAVPINGGIPFMVDSPSGDATGYYDVRWYRRTNSGAEHMTENRVAGVNVNDTLDVFCVITGADRPGGTMRWQVAVKGYTIEVVPAKLSGDQTVITQKPDTGNTGNPADNRLVVTPFFPNALNDVEYKFEVTYNGQRLELGKDYTIKDSSNLAKNAGTHTLTIEGMGNYTGEKSVTWTLEPYELSVENLCPAQIYKTYDGTDAVIDSTYGVSGLKSFTLDSKNLRNPILLSVDTFDLDERDYRLSNMKFDSAEVGDRTFTGTMTLTSGGNFVFAGGSSRVMQIEYSRDGDRQFAFINKAIIAAPAAKALQVANNHAATYTVDLSALLPKLEAPREYGAVTYGAPTVNLFSGYYTVGTAKIENGKLILPIQAVETDKTGSIGSVEVKVSTTNYHEFTLTINVNATNKIVPTGEPTLSKTTLAWGEQLSTIALSGAMTDPTDNTKTVKGKFEWVAPGAAKETIGEYEAAWKFTPTDTAVYAETSGTVTITVTKATPTGAPKYTAITTGGKTLTDAGLTVNEKWPEGTVQWVDENGVELDVSTEVKANTAYKWVFTPKDTEHYDELTGSITLYSVSGSSGGGGGSDSNPVIKTETKNHTDGSTTKTETRKDGSVTQTTTGKDGSTIKTETKKDGSSVTESKNANGSTGTVKTDKNGQIEANAKVSAKAVEDAKKNGEAVKAPVEVEASRDSGTAPTVKIELPKNSGDTKVEIPVTNVKPGTVAVIVHPDGTEEIVKNSLPTEDGIQLTVNGGATVKIVDNAKDFIDTQNHWAKDAIDFVSARELVNGISATRYAPDATATRAQLWTILARQNDADLSGGANWYEKAQLWSKDKGVSDGTNPNGTITRAQMVTMLWRTMGQPAAGGSASFADVPADSYYAQAVAWAIENGITAGVGNGRFDPNATCTRGQIATFLWRAMAE